jgi:ABC-type dipeptide/oligopeptide/nickel transport system ATPase component
MILQDPQTSLNPVFTIGNQLIEALSTHHEVVPGSGAEGDQGLEAGPGRGS